MPLITHSSARWVPGSSGTAGSETIADLTGTIVPVRRFSAASLASSPNGPIQVWPDAYGITANNASQAAVGSRPSKVVLGSFNAILLDGVNDYIDFLAASPPDVPDPADPENAVVPSENYCAVAVIKPAGTGVTQGAILFGNQNSQSQALGLGNGLGNGPGINSTDTDPQTLCVRTTIGTDIVVVGVRVTGGNGSGNASVTYYKNLTSFAAENPSSDPAFEPAGTVFATSSVSRIGGQQSTPPIGLYAGHIFDIMYWNADVTNIDTPTTGPIARLMAKYGVS